MSDCCSEIRRRHVALRRGDEGVWRDRLHRHGDHVLADCRVHSTVPDERLCRIAVPRLEDGMLPYDAAMKGSGEIGFTVMAITFSLIAVFIPLFLMSGYVGLLFRD